MLSSISGQYFAGHWNPGIVPPPSGQLQMYFNIADPSYTGGGTIDNLGAASSNDLAFSGFGSPTYVSTPPAYVSVPFNTLFLGQTPQDVRLNTTIARTMSIWFYVPTGLLPPMIDIMTNNNVGSTFDGAYIQMYQDDRLHFSTNGNQQNPFMNPYNMPRDQWKMITFVYIASATIPCRAYINGALVGTYLHGTDTVDQLWQNDLRISAGGGYGGRWSQAKVWDYGLSDAQILAEFTATRGYFGV